jgi:hypothetical protein
LDPGDEDESVFVWFVVAVVTGQFDLSFGATADGLNFRPAGPDLQFGCGQRVTAFVDSDAHEQVNVAGWGGAHS